MNIGNGCENARRFPTLLRRFRRAGSVLETAGRDEGMSISPNTSPRLREKFLQTVPQQPKPLPLKRPHALFLEDTVDRLPSNPAPKRYYPESVDSSVTRWVESLGSGSESYRERHCRSDTLLGCSDTLLGPSDSDIIPRRLTKSAPRMEHRRDADGFALPLTPASKSCLHSADADNDALVSLYGLSLVPSSSTLYRRSPFEDPYYRNNNLAENNISIRYFDEEFPSDIAGLINYVRRDHDIPSVSLDQVMQNTCLRRLKMGTGEADVESYFKANIFLILNQQTFYNVPIEIQWPSILFRTLDPSSRSALLCLICFWDTTETKHFLSNNKPNFAL